MHSTEILKQLWDRLNDAEDAHAQTLKVEETMALIACLPEMLSAKAGRDVVLKMELPQPKPFYVVHTKFKVPTEPFKRYEIMSCIAAESGEEARSKALAHIIDLQGPVEQVNQFVGNFTDPNITN